MADKTATNPTGADAIVSPVMALLRSRKTIVALATALVSLIVLAIPSLKEAQPALVTVFTILGTVLIASISHEDAGKPPPGTTSSTVEVSAQTVTTTPPANDAQERGQA